MTEEEFRQQVRTIGKYYGWGHQYHTYDSRRSDPGWVDEVFLSLTYERAIFIELKTDTGRPRPSQVQCLNALASVGLETALWRPSDIDTIKAVLGPIQRRTHWRTT